MFTLARSLRRVNTEVTIKTPGDLYLGRLYDSIQSHRDWIDFLACLNTR